MKEKDGENLVKEDPKIMFCMSNIHKHFKKYFSKHSACIQTSSEIGQNVFGF